MANPRIDHIFNRNRMSPAMSFLPLVLYAPIGFVLLVIRFFIGLNMLVAYSWFRNHYWLRSLKLRIYCGMLGQFITVDGADTRDKTVGTIISNHITPFDNFITDIIFPHFLLREGSLSNFIEWIFKIKSYSRSMNREQTLQFTKSTIQNDQQLPVVFYPEETTTNGYVGLLKFRDRKPFEASTRIQPITIQAQRYSFFNVAVTTLNSSLHGDVMWSLFVPFTVYKIRVLPVCQKQESEDVDAFTERVRGYIAKSLNTVPTDFTASDKEELRKDERRFLANHRATNRGISNITITPEMEVLVKQVQETLPDVPLAKILNDLAVTKDVDATIINILEGKAKDIPTSIKPEPVKSSKDTKVQDPMTFKASSFGNKTSTRQLSLEERKNAMYSAARKAYIEKHSMELKS